MSSLTATYCYCNTGFQFTPPHVYFSIHNRVGFSPAGFASFLTRVPSFSIRVLQYSTRLLQFPIRLLQYSTRLLLFPIRVPQYLISLSLFPVRVSQSLIRLPLSTTRVLLSSISLSLSTIWSGFLPIWFKETCAGFYAGNVYSLTK